MTNPAYKKLTELNSARFHQALIAGIQEVISRQDYLNRINVFPVPDRDTGTNMALTLNNIIEETPHYPPEHIGELLALVADAALNGSRGNSGAILAQFFQGLSEGAEHFETFHPQDFSQAIAQGKTYAYEALSKPQEGTILTILATLADSLNRQIQKGEDDFKKLMHQAIQDCQEACNATARGLKEMRRAKVVDAGAQGFVDFLKGFSEHLHKGYKAGFYEALTVQPIDEVEETVSEYLDSDYRYCTECLIEGENIDQKLLRSLLEKEGDSLIVAGSKKKTKIHIHTNAPQQVFDLCGEYGNVFNTKADDMIAQQQHINHHHTRIAIVTDSGADIPEDLLAELDIYVVPLSITFGTKSYIDKIGLTSSEFFALLAKSDELPKSSQPPVGEFNRIYQYLNSHHESIISIHLSSGISGTFAGSITAAKRIHNNRITNVDSKSATGGQGLIVIAAAIAAQANKTHNQILKEIAKAQASTEVYALIPDLQYVVKGGRVSAKKRKLLETFRLSPIVGVKRNKGTISIAGVIRGKRDLVQKFARSMAKKLKPKKSYRVLFLYADNLHEGKQLQRAMLEMCPQIKEHYLLPCSALIGVYGGPNALEVAFMEIDG